MRSFRNALYGLGLVGAAALVSASDVHELTKDTFKDFVAEHELVLAEFFAPWCGHCKMLAPEYDEAATQLKDKNIKLVKVDCTADQELCAEHGVEGYPTLKVFRGPDSKPSPYSGARKADAIISYMIKQSMPPVSILTKDTIEDFKKADKVVVVGYFEKDDKASNETFTELAKIYRDDFLFGAIYDADQAEADGVNLPGVALYKSFDSGKEIYTGESFEKNSLENFIDDASTPLVGEVGPDTYSGYMNSGKPLAYYFADSTEHISTFPKEVKSLAERLKSVMNFATIDANLYGAHAGNMNLEVGKWPAFVIQDTVKNEKYPINQDQELTIELITKHVNDYVAGKLKPSIKSEPIPEEQTGPVYVIVADSYEKEIMENDQDVLVEYYATWCGHCKNLAPKYEKLAEAYAAKPEYTEKVKIAKVDVPSNDVPHEVSSFPTIKLFPAGKKDAPIDYDGDRSIEDMAKFIFEKGTHKIDVRPELPKEEELKVEDKDGQQPLRVEDEAEDDDEADKKKEETADKKEKAAEKKEKASEKVAEKKEKASEKAAEKKEQVKDTVKDKVKEAAEKVKEVVMDGDEGVEGHDEL